MRNSFPKLIRVFVMLTGMLVAVVTIHTRSVLSAVSGSSDRHAVEPGPPANVAPVSGPFPDEKETPVSTHRDSKTEQDAIGRRLDVIDQSLHDPSLSLKQRQELQTEQLELRIKQTTPP